MIKVDNSFAQCLVVHDLIFQQTNGIHICMYTKQLSLQIKKILISLEMIMHTDSLNPLTHSTKNYYFNIHIECRRT